MVTKKKTTVGSKKLKLKKETIKDLQPRGKTVKGGAASHRVCGGKGATVTQAPTAGTQTVTVGPACFGHTAGCGVIPGH